MQIKIKPYIDYCWRFLQRLSDVRFAGQVLFAIIVLLVTWSGVKAIQTNYGLQKQVAAVRHQAEVQRLQNDNLKLQNEYFNSDQFLELSARQNFGLAAPNEKELVVPASVALAYTINPPKTEFDATAKAAPAYQRHLQAWINFFFHR